jgi:hypothetical protein
MRIMNFSQFLNESSEGGYSSFEALRKPLKDFFIKVVGKNILSKVVGLKNFSIELQGPEIYFVVNGNRILVPFINYVYDEVVPNTEALKDDSVIDSFYNNIGMDLSTAGLLYYHAEIYAKIISDEVGGIKKYDKFSYRGKEYSFHDHNIESNLSSLFYSIFDNIRNVAKDETTLLNPFTDIDLNNNSLVKTLNKLGAYVDTSEARKKKGILRFSIKDFNYGLIIQPNGYMRIDYGDKTPILTTKMEITAPAYTEDDLNLKLSYLVVYLMKNILKKYNVPVKTINLLAKFYEDSDFNEYDKLIKEISAKYPGVTSLLPDPNSVLDPNVKKGSSMLRRFGVI